MPNRTRRAMRLARRANRVRYVERDQAAAAARPGHPRRDGDKNSETTLSESNLSQHRGPRTFNRRLVALERKVAFLERAREAAEMRHQALEKKVARLGKAKDDGEKAFNALYREFADNLHELNAAMHFIFNPNPGSDENNFRFLVEVVPGVSIPSSWWRRGEVPTFEGFKF